MLFYQNKICQTDSFCPFKFNIISLVFVMKRYWHWHNRLWVSLSSGWFGIRKNFADFLLLSVPLLQEYVNVSYYKNQHSLLPTTPTTEDDKGKKQEEQTNTDLFPYEDIYAPEWQVGVVLIYFYSSLFFPHYYYYYYHHWVCYGVSLHITTFVTLAWAISISLSCCVWNLYEAKI